MASRRRPRERVFHQLLAAWELPEPDEIRRERYAIDAVYLGGGLRRHLSVGSATPGRLRRDVTIIDDELGCLAVGSLLTASLSVQDELIAVEGHPAQRRFRGDYAWPLGSDPLEARLVDEGRQFAAKKLWFLRDRAELGRLLLVVRMTEAVAA